MSADANSIEIIIESPEWEALPHADTAIRGAIGQAVAVLKGRTDFELAVLLTDDAAVQRLNATWRGLDKPTNVLSFPAAEASQSQHLGDIAIAFETTAREAAEEGKPLADHVAHLAVHGFLHLLGYDHESEAEAETMEQLERDILARIGVPDPYRAQSVEAAGA